MKFIRKWTAIFLVVLLLAGCASKSDPSYDPGYGDNREPGSVESIGSDRTEAATPGDPDQKLIERFSMEMESKEFESSADAIRAAIAKHGAYLDSMTQWNGSASDSFQARNLSMVIRVESAKTSALLGDLRTSAHVVSEAQSKENVTSYHRDLESRKNMLASKEKRLTALMEKAETIEDLISVETALSETIAEKEQVESEMRGLDNQIETQTISLTLREVRTLSPVEQTDTSFGERLGNALKGTWTAFVLFMQEFVIRLIYALPFLILLAGIGFLLRPIVRRRRKKRNTPTPPTETAPPKSDKDIS